MKISFDSPTKDTNGNALSPAELSSLTYQVWIDTVNPPVKSYPVAAAAVAAATTNADGSLHVTVDCVAGQATGFTPVAGTQYWIAASDAVDENGTAVHSTESAPPVSYTYTVAPAAPGNVTASA